MDYRVVFSGVEVEADSEEDAERQAVKIMAEDPMFFMVGATPIEEDEEDEEGA